MNINEIPLGAKVRCKITGFVGTVVARTEFINGCIQYNVAPKWEKGKNPIEQEVSIDGQSLEVIPKKKTTIAREKSGGPMIRGVKRRGY